MTQRAFRKTVSQTSAMSAQARRDENPFRSDRLMLRTPVVSSAPLKNLDVRRLWPADCDDIVAHLLRLDEHMVVLRFGGHVDRTHLEAHADKALARHVVMLGAYVDGVLRGLAELHAVAGCHEAEVAFTVERALQHHGIGSALMERLLVSARNRGIDRLICYCLPVNEAMQALAHKFKAELHFAEGEVLGELTPGPANLFTLPFGLFAEAFADAQHLWQRLHPLSVH